MNYGQLQVDLLRRGYDHVDQDRLRRWINESYHEVCNEADWPFLEASTSGAAPLTVADLRRVQAVHDATNRVPLRPTTRRWIVSTYGDVVSTTGVARFYYVENGVVRAYPVAGTITVYYYKVPTDLAVTTDVPIVPTRFHTIITDGAVRRALEDLKDYQGAQATEAARRLKIENMKVILLTESLLPDLDDQAEADLPPIDDVPAQGRR